MSGQEGRFPYMESNGDSAFADPLAEAVCEACKICGERVKPDKMRAHVCAHILLRHIDANTACGCCGGGGCTASLKQGSNAKTLKADVICEAGYFCEGWTQEPTTKDGKKCTNTPLLCSACSKYFWKYGMDAHWDDKHGGLSAKERMIAAVVAVAWQLGEKELEFMGALKAKWPMLTVLNKVEI